MVFDELETTKTDSRLTGWLKEDGTVWDFENDTINSNLVLTAQWVVDTSKSFEITIDNFTEITTSYTTKYTHEYDLPNYDGATDKINIEAYGVYKNNNGIQMNSGKGTYIKNLQAIPGAITSIELEWTATGKNSPTLYVSSGEVASTASFSLGKMDNSKATQIIPVTLESNYNYFYFDGTTVTGACYLKSLTIKYEKYNTPVVPGVDTFANVETQVSLGLNYTVDSENTYAFNNLRLYFKVNFDYTIFGDAEIQESGIFFNLGSTITEITESSSKIVNTNTEKVNEFVVELNAPDTLEGVKAMFATEFSAVAYVKINDAYYMGSVKNSVGTEKLSFMTMLNEYSENTEYGAEVNAIALKALEYYIA